MRINLYKLERFFLSSAALDKFDEQINVNDRDSEINRNSKLSPHSLEDLNNKKQNRKERKKYASITFKFLF